VIQIGLSLTVPYISQTSQLQTPSRNETKTKNTQTALLPFSFLPSIFLRSFALDNSWTYINVTASVEPVTPGKSLIVSFLNESTPLLVLVVTRKRREERSRERRRIRN
jgi:hypothetical protein